MLTAPPARPALHLRAWLVWGTAAVFVIYNYIQQVVPGLITADLARDFHVNAGALGALAAYFFYAYAVLQIPVGLAVDRFGPRWPLTLAIGVAAAGSLAFGWAPSAGWAGLARLVVGAGAAFSFIACLKLVSNWFAPGRFATRAGLTNTAGMIGAAAGAPLAALIGHTGWRGAVLLLGVVGVGIGVLALLLVRDRPAAGATDTPDHTQGGADGLFEALRGTLQSGQAWLNAGYATAISISFVAFGALWGPPYIAKAYGVGNSAATAVVAMLFLGAIAGSLFFGWYSDVLRSRRLPMLGAALGGLVTLAVILYVPGLPLGVVRGLLALLGFFCSANILSYAVAHDLSPPARAGLALGFLNTCYYGGSALSQPLVGWLLDRRCPAGLAAFQPADYRFAFSAVVILLVLAVLAACLLRETHPDRSRIAG
jgi:sugar phosphate permease